MQKKGNSMGNSFSPGCWDICLVAAVVVWEVPYIPGINTMLRPSFALLGCFVDECFYPWWCYGCGIVIKGYIHMGERLHMWVEARGAQHVEGILSLRQNATPQVQREIWVHGT